MRSIPAGLVTAIRAGVQAPALSVVLADVVERPTPTPVTSGSGSTGRSALIQLADGSYVQAYVNQPGLGVAASVYTHRITAPSNANQWNSWSLRSSGAEGQAGVALSVQGPGGAPTVRLFYQRLSDHAICYQESTDGVTWGAEQVACAQTGHCWALASGGNNDLFVAVDHTAGVDTYQDVVFYQYSAGSWSAGVTWTNGAVQIGGLDCVYVVSAPAGALAGPYYLVLGAQASQSGGLALLSMAYTGSSWSTPFAIRPLDDSTLGLSEPFPSLSYWAGLWRLLTVRYDSGGVSGIATQRGDVWLSKDFIHWKQDIALGDGFVNGAKVAPGPLLGGVPQGYIVADAQTVRETVSAAGTQLPNLDVSADVIDVAIDELVNGTAVGTITLDNSRGQYGSGSVAQPGQVRTNAQVQVSLGYTLGGVATTVRTHTLYVDGITYAVSEDVAELVLSCSGGGKRLERQCALERTYTSQTVGYLVAAVVAGAGLQVGSLPGTAQFSQTVASFVIAVGETWLTALQRLGGLYGFDWFVDETDTVQVREVQAGDASAWTYGAEIFDCSVGAVERPNHVTVTGAAPKGTTGAPAPFAEAWDYADVQAVGEERYLHVTDRLLTTGAQCQIRANLELRYAQRAGIVRGLDGPLDVGRQVLDVVTVSDGGLPGGGGTYRVSRLQWKVDLQGQVSELAVDLEVV